MDGLYDILYRNNINYDMLLELLYKLSKIVPLDYSRIEKELDGIYDDTEYEQYVEKHITINH